MPEEKWQAYCDTCREHLVVGVSQEAAETIKENHVEETRRSWGTGHSLHVAFVERVRFS